MITVCRTFAYFFITMRLKNDISAFIKSNLKRIDPASRVYLFGSRLDDHAKGGDIDILWLTEERISQQKIGDFKVLFYKNFGWQKIDIVNFTFKEEALFKDKEREELDRINKKPFI